MSTNIHIKAEREVVVVKTGKTETQTQHVDVWQTPSDVSRNVIKSADPLQAYFDWVLSVSRDEPENIYADDDHFCEREPVGTTTYNAGKEHVAELGKKIDAMKEAGYDIIVEVW